MVGKTLNGEIIGVLMMRNGKMNILDYIEYLESQGYSEDEINAFVDEAMNEGSFNWKEN